MSVALNAVSAVTSENIAVTNKKAKTDLDNPTKRKSGKPVGKEQEMSLFVIQHSVRIDV